MNLSSARDLKREITHRVAQTIVEERLYTPMMARSLTAPIRLNMPRPVAAFGVAPTERKRDYSLAVRVFAEGEANAGPVLEHLRRQHGLHSGEIDLATGLTYQPRRATVEAGTSCGHYGISAGTLGGFVEDDDYYYLLSNNHVIANSDEAFQNDPVLQPGPLDIKGDRFRVIGLLQRWAPLAAQGKVDAAIARLEADSFYPWWYRGIGDTRNEPVEDRLSVRLVIKRGRTTGVTRGRVSAFELDGISIDYGTPKKPKVVTFDDQLEFVGHPDPTKPFSQPGDSGSFILDSETLQPYALLYAGGPDRDGIDRTLGQFMPEVLESMGVWLVK